MNSFPNKNGNYICLKFAIIYYHYLFQIVESLFCVTEKFSILFYIIILNTF